MVGYMRFFIKLIILELTKPIMLTWSNGEICSICPLAINPKPVVKVMRTSCVSVVVIGIRIGPSVVTVGIITFRSRYLPFSFCRNKNVSILYLVIPHRSMSSDLVGNCINSIEVKYLRVSYLYTIRAL